MSVGSPVMEKTNAIRVVIIEDYKLTRVGLRYALNEFENINVVGESESAEEGIEIIKNKKPDIVLMDLGLPGINGLEAIIKLKEKMTDLKVIVLTSHEREEEVVAAFGSGANGYCLKDIEPQTLVGVITCCATGACWIDPNVAKSALKLFPKPDNLEFLSDNVTSEIKNQLTEREMEVLKHLVQGKSNTEIAKELIVSVHTAKAHVCSILQKLCVDDRVQAAVKAIKENLV
ncbi:response regulator transcription factor [bacterium]|nr:response regulator transcription factor [bacterium]